MRWICCALFALTLLSCNGSRQSIAGPASNPPSLEQELKEIRAKHDLPGLAATVVRGGQVVSSAVVGLRRMSAGDRLRIDDRFHIASCTKSMTATLAAIVVEEGRLEWSSRLADVLPELRGAQYEYQNATLEQLLAHAAKMPAYTQFGPDRLEELKALRGSPTEQRLAFLAEVLATEEPNNATGDAAYSNVGYTAAAAMMERATGESWENLIRSRLTQPLGMTSVGFGWPATSRTPEQPRGHFRRNGELVEQPLDDSYLLPAALWPAGAVNSSIGDLGRYAADHLNGLLGRKALLPQAAYEKLHRPPGGAEQGFTLGWGVRPDERWGVLHYGSGSGGTFFVRIAIAPEHDAAVVVASNSGEAAAATREVIERLLALYDSAAGS
ncbi:MAG TPA: serine hydrolase domain-containing protein [Thermoanaerobaculia bacterium]|nr:serine hydrolase domain-containing protein [Thermoanaerobaculia bacterium]